MKTEDYLQTWNQLITEKLKLADERTNLETELSEINTKISHLDEIMRHLCPLAGITDGENIGGLGITDAIRSILKSSGQRMSASDVRRTLSEKGFDLSGYTQPMASIYKILSRLLHSDEVEWTKEEDGKVFYQWKQPTEPEITDEDVPF